VPWKCAQAFHDGGKRFKVMERPKYDQHVHVRDR
jgi:hypothetical protein